MLSLAEHTIQDVAVPGILAVLVLKLVFDFIAKFKNGRRDQETCMARDKHPPMWAIELIRKTNELYAWHAPDESGEQAWKNKQMQIILAKVGDLIETNTKCLDRLMPILERLERRE